MAKTVNPRNMDTTAEDTAIPQPNLVEPKSGANDEDTATEMPNEPKQFPEIIGDGIASCMRVRTAHMEVEKELDKWVKLLPANKFERNKQLSLAREQIETARLALEAFYHRFRTLATSAKN